MDEVTRLERIDRRADHLLNQSRYDHLPATEVWDIAAEQIDTAERDRIQNLRTCEILRGRRGLLI